MTRVLLTGATGFVGQVLCDVLTQAGYSVRAAMRGEQAPPAAAADGVKVGDIGSSTDWSAALAGVDYIIHAAARAHVLHDDAAAAKLYFETNEHGTRRLAQPAQGFAVSSTSAASRSTARKRVPRRTPRPIRHARRTPTANPNGVRNRRCSKLLTAPRCRP